MLVHTSACGFGRISIRAATAWCKAAWASASQQEQTAAGTACLQQVDDGVAIRPATNNADASSTAQRQRQQASLSRTYSAARCLASLSSQHAQLTPLGGVYPGMQMSMLLPYQQSRGLAMSRALRKRFNKDRPRADASAAELDVDQEEAPPAFKEYKASRLKASENRRGERRAAAALDVDQDAASSAFEEHEASRFRAHGRRSGERRAAAAAGPLDRDRDMDSDDDNAWQPRRNGDMRRRQELEDYYYADKPRDRKLKAREYGEGDRWGRSGERMERIGRGRGEEDGRERRQQRGRGREERAGKGRPLTDPQDGWDKGIDHTGHDDSFQREADAVQSSGRRLRDWHSQDRDDGAVKRSRHSDKPLVDAAASARRATDVGSDKQQWGRLAALAIQPTQHTLGLLTRMQQLSTRIAEYLPVDSLLVGMSCVAMVNRTLTKKHAAAISLDPTADSEEQHKQATLVHDIMTQLTTRVGPKLAKMNGTQISKMLLAAATTDFTLHDTLLQGALASLVEDGCTRMFNSPEKALVQLLQALATMPAVRKYQHQSIEVAATAAASELHDDTPPAASADTSSELSDQTKQLLKQLLQAVTELLRTHPDAITPDALAQMTNSMAQLACTDLDVYDAVAKSLVKRDNELSQASVAQVSMACRTLMTYGCCVPAMLDIVAKRMSKKPTITKPANWSGVLQPFVHFQHDDARLFNAILHALPQALHEVPPSRAAQILSQASLMGYVDVPLLDTVMKYVAASEPDQFQLMGASAVMQAAQRAGHYEPELCKALCDAVARNVKAMSVEPVSMTAAGSSEGTQADTPPVFLRPLLYLLVQTATMGLLHPNLQLQALPLVNSHLQELPVDSRVLFTIAAAQLAALADGRAGSIDASDRRALLDTSLAAAATALQHDSMHATAAQQHTGLQQSAMLVACMQRSTQASSNPPAATLPTTGHAVTTTTGDGSLEQQSVGYEPASELRRLASAPSQLLSFLFAASSHGPAVQSAFFSPAEGLISNTARPTADAAVEEATTDTSSITSGGTVVADPLVHAVARLLKTVPQGRPSHPAGVAIPQPPVDVTWVDQHVVLVHPSQKSSGAAAGPEQSAGMTSSRQANGLAFVLTGQQSKVASHEDQPSDKSSTLSKAGSAVQDPAQQMAAWPHGGGEHALRCKLLSCAGYQVVEITRADWQRVLGWEDAEVALLQSKAGLLS